MAIPMVNVAALLLVIGVTAMMPSVNPQMDCVSGLAQCGEFLNSTTKPSEECCGALEDATKNHLTCLCDLLNNTALLDKFNTNTEQVLLLPKSCGISTNLSACKEVSHAPSQAEAPPMPGETTKEDNAVAALEIIGGALLLTLATVLLL